MIRVIPSAALCAHLHGLPICADQSSVDALVSTIYASSRKIDICKEIAYLAKGVISSNDIDLQQIHHLPLKNGASGVATDEHGIPYLYGKSYELVDKLLHMPASEARDKSLTLLTKLHGMVLPLKLGEATCRTNDMFHNIESPFEPDQSILNSYREYVKSVIETRLRPTVTVGEKPIKPYDTRWYLHLEPLHNLAVKYSISTKQRPHMHNMENVAFGYDNESQMHELDAYALPCILTNSSIRQIYLENKIEFLTLVTGYPVLEVLNDSHITRLSAIDAPIGRTGIRLQESEKIRLLWMNLAVFECLTQPAVDVLEYLVQTSKHQSAYLDDEESSRCIAQMYFPNKKSSDRLIYSIDQSNFTDNYPYKLQRILLEELYYRNIIPLTTLKSFDLQVLGPYQPAKFFKNHQEVVRFAKGTPMGAYGTWMLSSITHELLIEMIQDMHNHVHDEFVQGDDVVFTGDAVYSTYCDYMSRLGCSVNKQKTLISKRAVEYCGWITTPDMSCPMFRPHDRFHDHPKDVVSPRAVEAFGLDNLTDWIRVNRSGILDQLKIYGLIPISEDETIVASARKIYESWQKVQEIVPPDSTSEGRSILFDTQEYYPKVSIDPILYNEMYNKGTSCHSDLKDFEWRTMMMEYYLHRLLHDTSVDIFDICGRIEVLYDSVMKYHSDRIVKPLDARIDVQTGKEVRLPSFIREKKKRKTHQIEEHMKFLDAARDNELNKSHVQHTEVSPS